MNANQEQISVDRETFSRLCQEANINRRPLARHLFYTARYLGVGALVHAWFLGPRFDTEDLWSWAYLLAWPLPVTGWLIAKLAVFFLYAGTISIVCALIWWAIVEITERRGLARARREAMQGRDPRFRQPPVHWSHRE